VLTAAAVVGVVGAAALIPYFLLLGERSSNLDDVQLLSLTRTPDFASPVLIVGVLLAIVLLILRRRNNESNSQTVLFALSFALAPVVLFNQQVITGRSLQPVHYEIFIANYLVLAGMVLAISLWMRDGEARPQFRKAMLYFTLAVIGWGLFEAGGSTKRALQLSKFRDASVPAIQFAEADAAANDQTPVIHASNFLTADLIPTFSTAKPLWNAHSSSAGGIGTEEYKRLFYQYLYYSGFTAPELKSALEANVFEVTAAIFGSERALPSLGSSSLNITAADIEAEASKYSEFVRGFDQAESTNPQISHIIVPAEAEPDLSNLDRWYRRDAGTELGIFKVYRLTPR
jgi:hypothetical protein